MTDFIKEIANAIQNAKNDGKIDLLVNQLELEKQHYVSYKNSLNLEVSKCDEIIKIFDLEIVDLKNRKEVKNEKKN